MFLKHVTLSVRQVRHALNIVYTYSGDVLLAVNPWKHLPIYSAQAISTYQHHSDTGASANLPPHIFASAGAALRRIATGTRAQSIIIRYASIHYKLNRKPVETKNQAGLQSFFSSSSRHHNPHSHHNHNHTHSLTPSLFFSGESGSGKTETSKYVMEYIASTATGEFVKALPRFRDLICHYTLMRACK